MFCYQKNFVNPTLPVDEARFWALVRATQWAENIDKYRETGDAQLKRKLPAFIFQATFDETTSKSGKTGRWRKQAATRLTGLVVMDIDHIDDPKGLVNEKLEIRNEKCAELGILLIYITPSGKGLKIVFKARQEWGNLIDNQHQMAKLLSVEVDESCKDASRMSFICKEEDILYLDKELFTYENKAYAQRYDEAYRQGHSSSKEPRNQGNKNPEFPDSLDKKSSTENNSSLEIDNEKPTYHGTDMQKIVDCWLAQNGTPAVGDRHQTLLRMAGDLRYITDNSKERLGQAVRLAPYVRDMEREGATAEVESLLADVCQRRSYFKIPKRLAAVLASVGVQSGGDDAAEQTTADDEAGGAGKHLWGRLEPFVGGTPYEPAVAGVDDANKVGAVMAAGAMYCTLLTRTWYRHYDGLAHRMNPMVYIIGDPAAGKSFADRLDRNIMAAMRQADQPARDAEERYKREKRERTTSTKAQKGEALTQPEGIIRYLPSRTSNAVFYRRAINAKEEIGGVLTPLHLYTFDSELDSSITAQSGGSWIGKHDLELKAFHNELSGVDYANSDSVNQLIPIYWNQVVTGTPISLTKKITLRNINDGLCSRICVFRMESQRYKMIERKAEQMNLEQEAKLKNWGMGFEQLKGELRIQRLVDHAYNLCCQSAEQAEAEGDLVLDYLRKRAVFYAIWFTIPRIVGRAVEQKRQEHQDGDTLALVDVTDDDLSFATVIYDSVIYYQDRLFGQMLQDSWENAKREFQPRKRNTRNSDAYRDLPATFGVKDVMEVLGIENKAASQQCLRWVTHGFVERLKQGRYRKVIKEIMA